MGEKTIQLSPNSLNLFLECQHCFWLDKNLGIKRPQPYPYALNLAMDSLLEEEFDTYRAKNLIHPLLHENNIKARLFANQRLLNKWRNNKEGIKYVDPQLKATLFGTIEDVLEFADYKVAPLGYKSTEKPIANVYDRFQLQLDTYTFLLDKNGYKTTGKGYLVFYIVDKSKGFIDRLPFRKEVLEIDTNLSDIYEIFKDAVAVLRQTQPPDHSHDCQFNIWMKGAKNFIN